MGELEAKRFTVEGHRDPDLLGGEGGGGDDDDPHPSPLFLVPFPSRRRGRDDVLAYGGDDGAVTLLPPPSNDRTTTTAKANERDAKTRVVRRYDDCVRALAVSPDGRRVAVGFDDGSTKIYCYDDFEADGDDGDGDDDVGVHHPFLRADEGKDGGEEGGGGIMSQAFDCGGDNDDDGFPGSGSGPATSEFEGPRFDASLRGLAFDPRSGSGGSSSGFDGYHLAACSESASPPLAVCDVSSEAAFLAQSKRWLAEESESEHDGSGVRSLAYSSTASFPAKTFLATLGMDGRLVAWDVTSLVDPELDWVAVHRDEHRCVTRVDAGEGLGSDAGDRASGVVWGRLPPKESGGGIPDACLVLPGRTDVQFRSVPVRKGSGDDDDDNDECKERWKEQKFLVPEDPIAGHKDVVVSAAFRPDAGPATGGSSRGRTLVATGGRDGKVFLWEMSAGVQGDDCGPSGRLVRELTSDFAFGGGDVGELGVGIAPVTCLRWLRATAEGGGAPRDVLYAARADGGVAVISGDLSAAAPATTAAEKMRKKKKSKKTSPSAVDDDDIEEKKKGEAAATAVVEEERQFSSPDRAASALHGDDEDEDNDEPPPLPTGARRRLSKKGGNSASRKDDDDDVDFEADVTREDNPKDNDRHGDEKKRKDVSKFIDDEAGDGDDDSGDDEEYDLPPKSTEDAAAAKDQNEDPGAATVSEGRDAPAAEATGDDSELEDAFGDHGDRFDADDHDDDAHGQSFAPAPSGPPLQPAFAPASTPVTDPRRILCWNHVGVATLRPGADAGDGGGASNLSVVDVAFHDSAGRRPLTFTDNLGFIVGALGEEGGMFASDLAEDDDYDDAAEDDDDEFRGLGAISGVARAAARRARRAKNKRRGTGGAGTGGSNVYFHRYETFGRAADKDWAVALPDGERALGCATGAGWGAVMTSRRFLRLFTAGGVQGPVIWIPGEPVTVVGRSRFLAVFYHRSPRPADDGTQLLGYTLLDGVTGCALTRGEVAAVGPGASMTWAAFTDACALVVMDSDGVLSMLARTPSVPSSSGVWGGGEWMPLLDTGGLTKSASDGFWPTEVRGGKLVCVPLRGGRDHPDPARRPVATTLPLRVPLATPLSTKGGPLEEVSLRGNIALDQTRVFHDRLVAAGDGDADALEDEFVRSSAQVDKVTLKLFLQVVQAGKVERGLDLVGRLRLEQSHDIAIKAADRLGQRKLSDRIEMRKLRRFPQEEDEEEYEDGFGGADTGEYDDDEPAIATREERQRMMEARIETQGVSPAPVRSPPQPRSKRGRDASAASITEEESPPREAVVKRRIEKKDDDDDEQRRQRLPATPSSSKNRFNPFAKKRLESPAKVARPLPSSPTKVTLSRSSTFSAESREGRRKGKQIM